MEGLVNYWLMAGVVRCSKVQEYKSMGIYATFIKAKSLTDLARLSTSIIGE